MCSVSGLPVGVSSYMLCVILLINETTSIRLRIMCSVELKVANSQFPISTALGAKMRSVSILPVGVSSYILYALCGFIN